MIDLAFQLGGGRGGQRLFDERQFNVVLGRPVDQPVAVVEQRLSPCPHTFSSNSAFPSLMPFRWKLGAVSPGCMEYRTRRFGCAISASSP